jgi:hypothetical protein
MLELDELKAQLKTYEEPMQQMRSSLDLDNKEKRIEELERTMSEPGFWENPEKASKLQKELGALNPCKLNIIPQVIPCFGLEAAGEIAFRIAHLLRQDPETQIILRMKGDIIQTEPDLL